MTGGDGIRCGWLGTVSGRPLPAFDDWRRRREACELDAEVGGVDHGVFIGSAESLYS